MRERESGCKSSLSLSLTLSLLLFDALLCSENDLSGVEGEKVAAHRETTLPLS